MTEQGIVVDSKSNNYIQVRIGRNSACASCGKCGMTENQKHVDFFVENTKDAKVGDTVSVEISEKNAAPLAFVGYFLPLIPALALLFCGIGIKLPDWASLLMFFGGLVLGFCLVILIDKLRKHKWMQAPVLVDVIARAAEQHTGVTPVANDSPAENSEKEKQDE